MKEKCTCGKDAVWIRHSHEAEQVFTCDEHLEREDGEAYTYHAFGITREDANPGRFNDYNTLI